eukprot:scaffold5036_cov61-Phaeocystis_antarctica.AAC.3
MQKASRPSWTTRPAASGPVVRAAGRRTFASGHRGSPAICPAGTWRGSSARRPPGRPRHPEHASERVPAIWQRGVGALGQPPSAWAYSQAKLRQLRTRANGALSARLEGRGVTTQRRSYCTHSAPAHDIGSGCTDTHTHWQGHLRQARPPCAVSRTGWNG